MSQRPISLSDVTDPSPQRIGARGQPRVAAIIALSAGLGCIVAYILMTFAPASTDTAMPGESHERLAENVAEAELSPGSAVADAPAGSLGSVVTDGIQKLLAMGRETLGLSPAESTITAETTPATSTEARRSRKRISPAPSSDTARKHATDEGIGASAGVDEILDAAEGSLELLPAVYSDSDARVTPPSFERPQLPTLVPQSVPANEVGVLELLVTEKGEVEKVHLISPANRYRERMLVAAAKAWRFKPATLDGQPVRYRTTVRITL